MQVARLPALTKQKRSCNTQVDRVKCKMQNFNSSATSKISSGCRIRSKVNVALDPNDAKLVALSYMHSVRDQLL